MPTRHLSAADYDPVTSSVTITAKHTEQLPGISTFDYVPTDSTYTTSFITMKTDTYLNICLEQAAKSPLHYRHGAVVVRGGKVIGKGYNDHRSGFDGGALKTGRLSLGSKQGSTVANPKKNQKLKRDRVESEDQVNKAFTPFESLGGGGKLANTPLSMHSEMMAIHSALSTSSTFASSAVSSEKPCFKLPGGSKPQLRLRREAVKSYVKIICEAAPAQSTAGS